MIAFERIRTPLLILTVPLALYGIYAFCVGKQAIDKERKNSHPVNITLNQIMRNPPEKQGWYTLTDGTASLLRGYMLASRTQSGEANWAVFYYPVLRQQDVPGHENVAALARESKRVSVIIRTHDPSRTEFFHTMLALRKDGKQTANAWMQQNRKKLLIPAPFTGVLKKPTTPMEKRAVTMVMGSVDPDCRILLEGEKPAAKANMEVTAGLALIMGVPTLWLFVLLITGKLAPPDEEILPDTNPAKPSARPAVAASGAMVMPDAMPIPQEELTTKKPSR